MKKVNNGNKGWETRGGGKKKIMLEIVSLTSLPVNHPNAEQLDR